MQFRFVDSKDNPQPVNYNITFDIEHKKLRVPVGILQHMTLGIANISSSHKPEEYRFWDMKAYNSDALTYTEQGYYLYAKVERSGTEGRYLISPAPIAMDADMDYYHLLVGILNSEYEEDRSFVTMCGFTEILQGRITTDKIVSSNDLNFIDLVNGSGQLASGNITWDEFGNLITRGRFESNKEGDRIILDPVTKSLKLINPSGKVLGEFNFINLQEGGTSRLISNFYNTLGQLSYYTDIQASGIGSISLNSDTGEQDSWSSLGSFLLILNRKGNSPRFSVNTAANWGTEIEMIVLGLPQMDDPIGVLEKGQVYRDSNNFLRIVP